MPLMKSQLVSVAEYREIERKRSKYGNRKVVKNGETWDSVREYERHLVLVDMQKQRDISGLLRQPKYSLTVNETHICWYIGDWFYMHGKQAVVEDCKGFATAEWKLKFKLAKALFPQIDWRTS